MKTQNRGISTPVGILIILIAIIAAGSIAIWQLPKLPKEEVVPQEDETADLSRDEVLRDWKTYRNEEYGFEIKYLSDWRVETEGLGGDIRFVSWGEEQYRGLREGFPVNEVVVEILVRANMTLEKFSEFFKSSECYPNLISETKITLLGYPAKKVVCIDKSFGEYYRNLYLIQKDNTIYELRSIIGTSTEPTLKEDFDDIFNQMLSTFRFLE